MNKTTILYMIFYLIVWGIILYNYNWFLEKYKKGETKYIVGTITGVLILFNYEKLYNKKVSSIQKNYFILGAISLILFNIKLYIDKRK